MERMVNEESGILINQLRRLKVDEYNSDKYLIHRTKLNVLVSFDYPKELKKHASALSEHAARHNSLETLQWMHKFNLPCSALCCAIAAQRGNFEMVQWAYTHGATPDASICSSAASCGNLEILKWLRAHGCAWDEETCNTAAIFEDLKMLQWARENGCPWSVNTFLDAVRGRNIDVMMWVCESIPLADSTVKDWTDWIEYWGPNHVPIEVLSVLTRRLADVNIYVPVFDKILLNKCTS